ncbi:glycosyl hydrolase family 61-domain-containing protein [Amylocarpus encephaloides]|uniref:lytic cellulose monooxygenase (C4-dehydrogenating) n=1 Tax=Amylocarpus encephaloides TaxID=45428 RepID=A0A9P7YPA6_9HELO|nr:glycosyl hydrolase family 61-domain-containing protein [Amylocarpus encephaloides]
MKLFILAFLAQLVLVHAHYNFNTLIHEGVTFAHWQYLRKWHTSKGFFTGDDDLLPIYMRGGSGSAPPGREKGQINTIDMRCNVNATNAPETLEVTAGDSIGFKVAYNIGHVGPMMAYMARVPEGKKAIEWDGDGKVWFKVYEDFPSWSPATSFTTWPNTGATEVHFTIPPTVPSGEYLFKVEHLALHVAYLPGGEGPQFFITCAQLKVGGGGDGKPGPLVEMPGAYDLTDPIFNVSLDTTTEESLPREPYYHRTPGPAVWKA